MPYPANKFNKLQESRRPDKRSASGDFAFVIRLNPGMIARISIKISDEQRSLRSQSSRLSADGHFNARTCREGGVVFGEEGFVGSINGCEVVQIFYKHGSFNDVAHFRPAASTIAFTLSSD
ncbi:Uncharacterised protein [Escherichia coli]|nr:Uncharacterised protein [Escherichia coli]